MFAKRSALILFLILLASLNTNVSRGQQTDEEITSESVKEAVELVADWQLKHPYERDMGDWVQGPFINGLMAAGQLPGGRKYVQAAKDIGKNEEWGVIQTPYRANDHCTPQTWIELYEIEKDSQMIAGIQAELDRNMAVVAKQDDDLTFNPNTLEKWSWCDALYMSPPAYARMGKVTGRQEYFDFLNEWWWKVSDFYYDKDEQLYFRDETFFNKKEPNGSKVFWSRGNGWVVGGLVRVLQYLPEDDKYRPMYEKQLAEMLGRLKTLQGDDGLWGAGLLDRNAYPQAETSGSAFFVYGFAYAMNQGIIPKGEYRAAAEKAWKGLLNHVKEDGRFTGIQPIGDSPKTYDEGYSMPYGVGAFLLAGSEMYKLLGGQPN